MPADRTIKQAAEDVGAHDVKYGINFRWFDRAVRTTPPEAIAQALWERLPEPKDAHAASLGEALGIALSHFAVVYFLASKLTEEAGKLQAQMIVWGHVQHGIDGSKNGDWMAFDIRERVAIRFAAERAMARWAGTPLPTQPSFYPAEEWMHLG